MELVRTLWNLSWTGLVPRRATRARASRWWAWAYLNRGRLKRRCLPDREPVMAVVGLSDPRVRARPPAPGDLRTYERPNPHHGRHRPPGGAGRLDSRPTPGGYMFGTNVSTMDGKHLSPEEAKLAYEGKLEPGD